ncbi:AAA family ATPase (plasmid) [Rhizobium grahamii]|uniref:AAA family ATPase n=1 Tax=Rhizobium grahamii TaxID=1120045 RepID=A0A5Q0CDY0_9HYPH|nr:MULTISPECIES: ATP-binding protein [Rhizobium]QFY62694.1 AAA family ATPase [Rhizobium grahamii]QRM52562.1 AAA family ATPase [Rhizobium sp. BG6]
MTEANSPEVHRALRVTVRSTYIDNPMDELVNEELAYFVKNIDDFKAGAPSPRRGVFIYGPSGTGKTTTVKHAIAKMPEFLPYVNKYGQTVRPALYVKMPHQCAKRDFVVQILKAMGLPTEGTLAQLRDTMMEQLKEREISLLHLDELQHTVRSNTAKAFEAIQDLLKEMLDRDDWHLHMVLSGMPRIHKMRQDKQIFRRTHNIPFHTMDFEADEDWIKTLMAKVAKDGCGLTFAADVKTPEFRERLSLAVHGAWGTMIEVIQNASFRALDRGRTQLTKVDFAREYEKASGLTDEENVFLVSNYRDLAGSETLVSLMED